MGEAPLRPGRRLDVAAVCVVLVAAAATFRLPPDVGERALGTGAWPAVLALALAAGLARRRPWPSVAIGVAGLAGYTAADYLHGPLLVSCLLLVFLVGLVRPWWHAVLAGAALTLAAVDWYDWIVHGHGPWAVTGVWQGVVVLAAVAGAVALPVLAAEVLTQRRVRVTERARAAHQERQRAIAQQRLSLAQDVHDTVAHALSVITLQARAGLREAGDGPGAHRLQVIADVGKATVADLSVLVRDLRGEPARAPQPTLADVPDLVRQAGGTGQRVELAHDLPDAAPVPATLGTVGYRVVQEALTNARRHAPGAHTRVTVSTDQGLDVQVHTAHAPVTHAPGTHAPLTQRPPEPGSGLTGMRERVEGSGGVLHAGPTGTDGWLVHARWQAG